MEKDSIEDRRQQANDEAEGDKFRVKRKASHKH